MSLLSWMSWSHVVHKIQMTMCVALLTTVKLNHYGIPLSFIEARSKLHLLKQKIAFAGPEMQTQRNTIIWDLDGTLVDSAKDLEIALNLLLAEEGLPVVSLDQVRGMIGNGVGALIRRGFMAAGHKINIEEQNKLQVRYMQLYLPNAANNTKLYPLAKATLKRFALAGFVQGICTNKPVLPTHEILKTLGIADYFAAVVGGDSLPIKKPSPDPLYECMELLGSQASKTFMIGDSAVDAEASHSAGVPFVFISHGYCHVPPHELDTSIQVDSFDELSLEKIAEI